MEEDLRTYGIRHEPSDVINMDQEKQLSKFPQWRSTPESEGAVDDLAKAPMYDHRTITAMDWNAGESPIMAWVNQRAISAAIPQDTSRTNLPLSRDNKLL